MKIKHRSKQSSSSHAVSDTRHTRSLGQTNSRPSAQQKKQQKQRQRGLGDDTLIRRDAQKYRDFTASIQRDFERSLREDRASRPIVGLSNTPTPDTSSRTGVFYDDEAFWVIYQGTLIATGGSASEGRDILKAYSSTATQR